MWSPMTISVPGRVRRVDAAGRVGQDDDPRTERAHEQHRLHDESGGVALVEVEPALEQDDRDALDGPEQQPPRVARSGRRRPAREIRERDRDGTLERVGEAAQPRAQDDPDARNEVGSGADGGDERGEARRLLDRGWNRASALAVGHVPAELAWGGRSVPTAERRTRLRPSDESTDTGMPVTSRRTGPAGGGQRSARSDRRESRTP